VSRRDVLILSFLCLLLLTPSQLAMARRGVSLVDYRWGTQTEAITVHSGDGIVPLIAFFKVNVEENHTLRPIEAVLKIPSPLKNPNGGQEERIIPGLQFGKDRFEDGEGFYLLFNVEVPTQTPPDRYLFSMNLSYEILDEDGDVVGRGHNTFSFSLEVKGKSSLEINFYGKCIKGESTVLHLSIRNNGIEDIKISSIQLSSSIIRILNPSIQQGTLLPTRGILRYDIGAYVDENVDQDSDKVAIVVYYMSGGRESSISKVFTVPLLEKNEEEEASPSIVVLSDKYMLNAGISNEVTLTIKNVGDEIARKVKLQLSSKDITVLGPSLFDLGDLGIGDSRTLKIRLLPSEDAKSYLLNLQFTYTEKEDNEDVTKQLNTEVGFGRIEEARVVITSLEAVYSSGRVRIKGTLANVGNRAADNINVTVELGPCAGSSTYLGELDDGESTGFLISCKADGSNLSAKLRVVVKYLASPENWKESRREVSVEGISAAKTQPKQEGIEIGIQQAIVWTIAGIIVGLVLGKVIFGRRSEVEVP